MIGIDEVGTDPRRTGFPPRLLSPDSRPLRWALVAHPDNEADYLQEQMGWRYEALEKDAKSTHERVYDPALAEGLSNVGHSYGAKLSADEKHALIEFLKTL